MYFVHVLTLNAESKGEIQHYKIHHHCPTNQKLVKYEVNTYSIPSVSYLIPKQLISITLSLSML